MTPADDHIPQGGDDDFVAAEYVLGVLPAPERETAARRIDTDPAFARLVEDWEKRLSPMAEEYSEVAPPPRVKDALYRRLYGASEEMPRGLARLWQSVVAWRLATALSLAAAIAVAFVAFGDVARQDAGQQRYVASLSQPDSDVHYVVVYDPDKGDLGLSHVTGPRPEGRDFELWVIDDGQPRSLGIIPSGSSVHLAIRDAQKQVLDTGEALAISAEPQGGSPTGQPTGPIVAQGSLNAI